MFVSVIIGIAIIHTSNVFAYDLPSSYWRINNIYEAAVDDENYSDTIEYGIQIINLISNQPSNEQTINIMASRSYEVAMAYFITGDYENALKYFDMSIPYSKEMGWDDAVTIAENCVKQFTSGLDVYQQTNSSQKTYGVKNEPNGVLYGQVSEGMQSNDSMVLLYLEYGDTSSFSWAKLILEKAKNQGKSVELALNFPDEGTTAKIVSSANPYLSSLYSMLSNYSSVPIYLRIGAEFNVWTVKCTPDEFIPAFKIIADKMKSLPNISIVWSMAHTSTWKSEEWPYTADDFYPGDDYVDWVGVNCYINKYFQGKTWEGESKFNEVCFKSGYNADPVLMVQEAIEKYGDRKPIMISECGSGYITKGNINQTDDEWAAYYLKQMYSFIPMVYPQVKMIAYFNRKMTNEINYYDLNGSTALQSAYNNAVKSSWFIQKKSTNSAETFFEKADDTISTNGSTTLYSYPHLYGSDSITVDYYLDGNIVSSTSDVPYAATLNGIRDTHTLKVVATGNNGTSMTREYTITGNAEPEKVDNFSDTSNLSSVQRTAVNYIVDNNIMSGYEDNTLRPDNTITRAEFATMICRFKGYEATEDCSFSDTKNHWSSKYVNACVKAGAIKGMDADTFAPELNITVEQAAKILTVVCGYAGEDTQYPYGFMAAAADNDLLNNLTNSEMGTQMKRIDVAMLIYNASVGNSGENTVSKTTPKPTTQPTTNTKTSSWSNWSDSLPSGIDSGSYDIETKTQYSYRKKSYIELDYTTNKYTLERVEKSYGNWSDWQDSYIAETDSVDVETREKSTPKKYHYAHYCTGKYDNPSYVYQTSNYKFCNEATYHDLGWFESPLSYSSDSTKDYVYYVNGSIYKCSNTCYRWYLMETSGGTYTQYRSRTIKKTYIYQTYTDWSDYSDKKPSGSDIEVRECTLYRYKEK
jgi:hypothetical protein